MATGETTIGEIANTDRLVLGAYRGPTHSGHFLGAMDEVVIEMANRSGKRDQKNRA